MIDPADQPAVAVEPPRGCPGCGRIVSFCERCGRRLAVDVPPVTAPVPAERGKPRLSAESPSFRAVFRRCGGCGQYTGDECWNLASDRCFNCAPDPVAEDVAQAYASVPGPVCGTCAMPMPRETRQVGTGAPLEAVLGHRRRRVPGLRPLAARIGAGGVRAGRRVRALPAAALAGLVWPFRALASGVRGAGSRLRAGASSGARVRSASEHAGSSRARARGSGIAAGLSGIGARAASAGRGFGSGVRAGSARLAAGGRGFTGAVVGGLDRIDSAVRGAAFGTGRVVRAAGRQVRAAMPSATAWRSLRPLTPVLIAVLAVGGVALLTRDRPASGGAATRAPVGVAAPTSPGASPVASASPVVSASPVAGGGATATAGSTPETTPTPPLTGEQPRVEVSRSTVRAWRDALGSVRAQVVVEVRNDGPGMAALRSGTVSYTLRDAGGSLLYEGLFAYAFPSRLRPTESAYLVDTAMLEFVDPEEVGGVEVVLRPAAATRDSARLQVEDVTWQQAASGSGLEVAGRVANLGTEVHDALVAVILLDAQGGILGAVYDNADAAHIAAGGRAEFRTAYPGTPPLAPTDVAEVLAIAFDP